MTSRGKAPAKVGTECRTRVGIVTPDPGHPLLAEAAALLADGGHDVEVLHPEKDRAPGGAVADVYLLKARTPRALALARALEQRGAPVVNSAAATAFCQDRTAMAERARHAGLPFAATRTYDTLARFAESVAYAECAADGPPSGSVVVKSRHSRRDDLVARVDSAARLRELAETWPGEPVVVQPYAVNSGWDHKLWVVGGRLFAALRRSELAPSGGVDAAEGGSGAELPDGPVAPEPGVTELVHRVGEVFALDVYGVDVIHTDHGTPLIVDINAFPGVRGQQGAPEALAALALLRAGVA